MEAQARLLNPASCILAKTKLLKVSEFSKSEVFWNFFLVRSSDANNIQNEGKLY